MAKTKAKLVAAKSSQLTGTATKIGAALNGLAVGKNLLALRRKVPVVGVGAFAGIAIGGYLLYRYRFEIQSMLEQAGVKTPWLTSNPMEAIRSGAAKLDGALRKDSDSVVAAH